MDIGLSRRHCAGSSKRQATAPLDTNQTSFPGHQFRVSTMKYRMTLGLLAALGLHLVWLIRSAFYFQ